MSSVNEPSGEVTIVGWDGSPEAQVAIEWAARRAARRGGSLDILTVSEDNPDGPIAEHAAEALRHEFPGLLIRSETISGDPVDVFARRSEPGQTLVFGTRRDSAPHFRFTWNFGGRLVEEARGPVIIVPQDHETPQHGILVGVDESRESQEAVRFAADEARSAGTSLDIVHAWLGPIASPIPGFNVEKAPWMVDAHKRVIATAAAIAHEVSPSLRTVTHVDVELASHSLVNRARQASMVVVGARGRGHLAALAFGSVSTTLLSAMPCPVVILGPNAVAAPSGAAASVVVGAQHS